MADRVIQNLHSVKLLTAYLKNNYTAIDIIYLFFFAILVISLD